MSMDLGRSPYMFSKSHNKFVFEGCGNAVMMDHGSALIGCSTNCFNEAVSDKNCVGITCCQATIPHHLKSYTVNLTRLGGDRARACGSVFLVDKDSSVVRDNSFIPVSLLWTLTYLDSEQVTCCDNEEKETIKVDVGNSTGVDSWKCSIDERLEGNAYLIDGCHFKEECSRCEGFCQLTKIYDTDGQVKDVNFTCFSYGSFSYDGSTIAIYVVVGVFSISGLIGIIYASYKLIKKFITKRRRKSVFKRINRGLLMKQQEVIDPSLVDQTILFTSRQLKKATHNFNPNRIIGKGGQGTVYKGMLPDGRIVAVKKSKLAEESQIEQFINEVVILSQINHRHVVKLLGCCLETEVPMLVYEFISNGTLFDRLHDDKDEFPFPLSMRVQIATEVAQAIAYLHSATSIPIYHGDIKSSNILLDDKHRVKVSDFGTSRFVSMDQTHLTTLVKGTLGYLDPEYFRSSHLTEKSDVYSFGVVIVELLTGEKPISQTVSGQNKNLVTQFMLAVEEGRIIDVFDATVIKEDTRDELLVLANLATRCLHPTGINRPTMKEIATELEIIRTSSRIPSNVQTNIEQVTDEDEISIL